MASDHAAKNLIEFMNDGAAPHSVNLAAARDLLDRADLSGTSHVEFRVTGFEASFARAVKIRRPRVASPGDIPADTDTSEFVEAEVVADEPSAGPDAQLPKRDTRRSRASTMFSQSDLQDGEVAPRPALGRRRERPTEWERWALGASWSDMG